MNRKLPWWGRVIVYAATGWCIELFFTGVANMLVADPKLTGYSYLWMLPIWGFGVYALEHVSWALNKINLGIRFRIVVFMIAAFSLEYISGFTIKTVAGIVPWDYTQAAWNVDALIRLDYAPFWALTGIFLEPFVDFVKKIEIKNNLGKKQ